MISLAKRYELLEKNNRREELVSEAGAGVAELGQTRNKLEGLNARDSRSRPVGVREFKSHPLHQNLRNMAIILVCARNAFFD